MVVRRSSRPKSRVFSISRYFSVSALGTPQRNMLRFCPRRAASARFSMICISAAVPVMGSWNTRPRNGARLYSHRPEISTPSMRMEPESTGHTPETALSMVDLPAPLPPMTVQKSPSSRVRFRF